MYTDLREPGGRIVTRQGSKPAKMSEEQAFNQLATMRQRLERIALQQGQLGKALGVPVQLGGVQPNYGAPTWREVPTTAQGGRNLQESFAGIFANDVNAQRLAEAAARGRDGGTVDAGASAEERIAEAFKDIYGRDGAGLRLAEQAAQGRGW